MDLFFRASGHISATALYKKDVSLATLSKMKVARLLVPTVVYTVMLGTHLAICLAQGRVKGVFQTC